MKGHLQQDVVCHGCLRRVMSPCWAAEPGDRGVHTGVEVVGSCCCGFCLLWIVSCLNPDTETPGRRCFLLQEETAGWGGGRHEVSAVGWFHAGLCPFWSRSREPGSPAGARGGTGRAWRCWDSCRGGRWRGGSRNVGAFPRGVPGAAGAVGSAAWARAASAASAAQCSLLSQHPAAPRDAAEGGQPLVTLSPHRAPLLPGTFTNHISHFSRFGAALGAGWLIVTSLIVLCRES